MKEDKIVNTLLLWYGIGQLLQLFIEAFRAGQQGVTQAQIDAAWATAKDRTDKFLATLPKGESDGS